MVSVMAKMSSGLLIHYLMQMRVWMAAAPEETGCGWRRLGLQRW